MPYPNATHYSPHFSRRELDCRCGCDAPAWVEKNLAELATYLETLRAALGVSMTVHCAFRCPTHNLSIGGAPNGEHPKGTACDFSTKKHTPKQAMKVAEKISRFFEGGMHAYLWGTHVDIGPGPRRW